MLLELEKAGIVQDEIHTFQRQLRMAHQPFIPLTRRVEWKTFLLDLPNPLALLEILLSSYFGPL